MTNTSKGRNVYLDLFKFFLCYLVIAIHVAATTYDHFPLYRLAVPMFFMISGYFNYTADKDKLAVKSVAFIKRTLHYMLVGFGIYIIFDLIMCYVNDSGVGYYFTTLFYEDFILEFLILNRPITYTGAQLWFLIALFVVSLIHYALVRFDLTKYYKVIVPVGFILYFFFAGVIHLLQDTDMPIRYTRNALFFGLPNFGLGYCLARFDFNKKPWYKYIYLALGILCFLLQTEEYLIWESNYLALEMYITGVLSAVFLLLFFLGIKKADCPFYYKWIGKNAPFYIYILHMAVSVALGKLFEFDTPKEKVAWVFVISFAIYEAAHLVCMAVDALKARKKCQANFE